MAPPTITELKALAVLAAKGMALVSGALLTVAAICLLIPDGNDYAQASVLKHRRLLEAPGRRIVLVGGSNLAFGVDSTILEQKTGCSVINMGMNGYLGVKFMLREVAPHLRPQDIVVVALEYDSFFKPVDGRPSDQLMVVKANPRTFSYLDAKQRLKVLQTVPYVAQQKVLRLIREAKDDAMIHLFERQRG